MKKVETHDGYDFYIAEGYSLNIVYNIVPEGSPAPVSGYFDRESIEKIKGVRFNAAY
jgi:hypothetical protein